MIKSASASVLSLLADLEVDIEKADHIADVEIMHFDQWVNRTDSTVKPTCGSCVMS